MSENKIGKTICRKRLEAGLTQLELANYIGVSKATVSKWESGKNLPDIALLPVLASFFDITVDELMDYKPQISEQAAEKLYNDFTTSLSYKSADEVFEECRNYIHKYYYCYHLNLKLCSFMYNHYSLADNPSKILHEICGIAERIFKNCKSHNITIQAKYIYICTLIQLKRYEEAEKAAESLVKPVINMPVLLSFIYYSQGKNKEAESMINSYIEQNLQLIFSAIPNACLFCTADDTEKILKRYERILLAANADEYYLEHMIRFYFSKSILYCNLGECEKALDSLEQFAELFEREVSSPEKSKNPQGKADSPFIKTYFTQEHFSLKVILSSVAEFLLNDDKISILKGEKRFTDVIKKLKTIKRVS